MAGLKLEHIYKVYPNGTKAVSDFCMDIKDGEFIVFVGPSGCGKSTTLRMIAGLEDISAGELYIDNKIVNDVTPKDRDIAMVFQNYALYPHMTVYENMAFGLRLRHLPNDEIHRKVMWAADVLGLRDYLDRKPNAMSGGQRQRVSLGRAILRNPKVMLLDEPLSNLDAKLRSQMRSEIAKLHQELKTTFIYVTHDQVEAMTLGTRVVVMKLGVVQQIDTPKNLYDYPGNKFVAGFIGTPQMNFFEATLTRIGENVEIKFEYSDNKLVIPYNELLKVNPNYLDGKHVVYVGLRCEDISLNPEDIVKSHSLMDVKISHFEELGNETLIYGDINMQGDGFKESSTRVIIKAKSSEGFKIGEVVKAHFNIHKCHFFDKNTELSIVPRLPSENAFNGEIKNGVLSFLNLKITLPKVFEGIEGKGDLLVPLESITLNSGDIKAKITNIERINDTDLLYLVVDERTFFAKSSLGKFSVGQEINVDIDLSKIYFKIDGKDVIKPLKDRDPLIGKFVNLKTALFNLKDESIVKEKNDTIEALKVKHNALIEEENAKFAKELEKAKATDVTSIKAMNDSRLNKLKEENKAKFANLKSTYQEKYKALKADHIAIIKKLKAENKEIFLKKKETENREYKEFILENKDKDALRKRKEDHRIFKEIFPKDKANDLDLKLSNETLRYDSEITTIKGVYKRGVKELKLNYSELRRKCNLENNPVKAVTKAHFEKLKELGQESSKEIEKANLIFFMKFNNYYYELNSVIANKLIQGLGSSVFSKQFKVELPHDAYIITDDPNSLTVVVKGFKDYGKKKYMIVGEEGSKEEIYILVDKFEHKVGDTLKVKVNLENSIITETTMNIRLY